MPLPTAIVVVLALLAGLPPLRIVLTRMRLQRALDTADFARLERLVTTPSSSRTQARLEELLGALPTIALARLGDRALGSEHPFAALVFATAYSLLGRRRRQLRRRRRMESAWPRLKDDLTLLGG